MNTNPDQDPYGDNSAPTPQNQGSRPSRKDEQKDGPSSTSRHHHPLPDAAYYQGGEKHNSKRLALLGGIALLAIALVFYVLSFSSPTPPPVDGEVLLEKQTDIFPQLMYIMAVISALMGSATVAVIGFIMLLTGFKDSPSDQNPDELAGETAPSNFRQKLIDEAAEPGGRAKLDLRGIWSPCLVYIFSYAFCMLLLKLGIFTGLDQATSKLMEAGVALARLGNLGAFLLFLYFWLAGLMRVNQAGLPIDEGVYIWPGVAIIGFFFPIIFL